MAANIIDSFMIALGFRVDPTGAQQIKKQVSSAKDELLSLGTAVKAFATGYVVKEIASINSAFEQNRIQIATFLNALSLSPSFEQGLNDASDIIAQITRDAAKLPGEAEEYVEVFKTNAAYLKNGLPGANASEIADFTNRLTAVAKTVASTMDAGQIARESGMLLATEGRAGSHNVLWQKLMPILMQVDGQAKITAQSFNAMTQPQRVELLKKAFDKLQPGLDEASNTFDAMWGAAVSGAKQFVRAATPAIFKGMKEGLESITGFFINDAGKLTANGQAIADVLGRIGHALTRFIRLAGTVVGALARFIEGSTGAKLGIIALAAAVIGFQKALRFGLIGAILLIIEDLQTFREGGQSVVGLLMEKFPEAINVAKGLLAILGTAFVALQAKAIASAVATGAAWMIANLPLVLMLAAVGALIVAFSTLISKWEEIKATAKGWTNIAGGKLADTFNGLFGGDTTNEAAARARYGKELEDIAYRKAGNLEPGSAGPAYRPGLVGTPASGGSGAMASSPSAPQWQAWEPSMGGTTSNPAINNTNNTTINVNGAGDPKTVAKEVVKEQERVSRGAVRQAKKGYK